MRRWNQAPSRVVQPTTSFARHAAGSEPAHVTFNELAELELYDAIQYYEQEQPGLGAAFLAEVLLAVMNLKRRPWYWVGRT